MGEPLPTREADVDLNAILVADGLSRIDSAQVAKFDDYLALILRWNARMNLTAVRDSTGILHRHFVESIACAQHLPAEIHSLLDFGSGAGFPGIPIAICRPDINVTLAESQGKKASFLREAVRTLELNSRVWDRRAEELGETFDCVVLRAVDRMERAVKAAAGLVRKGGWLGVLSTQSDLANLQMSLAGQFDWSEPFALPGSDQRVLGTAVKAAD